MVHAPLHLRLRGADLYCLRLQRALPWLQCEERTPGWQSQTVLRRLFRRLLPASQLHELDASERGELDVW